MGLLVTERKNGSLRVQKVCTGESLTEQSHRPGANINGIVARARKGIMPELQTQGLTYGDFSSEVDFLQIQERMAKAKFEFMLLPSAVRKKFQNSPGALCEFLDNPDNWKEAQEMGFAVPKVEPEGSPAPGEIAAQEGSGDPPQGSEAAAGQ